MTGTETKITLEDIQKVAIAISERGREGWDIMKDDARDFFMLQALNVMFTPEEQAGIVRALKPKVQEAI